MQCEYSAVELVAAIARALELFVAALGALLTIYLGWKLYKDALLSKVEGSAAFHGMKFKMVAAGPGVFFALFGMYLLVSIVNRPAQISRHTSAETHSEKGSVPARPSDSRAQFASNVNRSALILTAASDAATPEQGSSCLITKTSTSSDVVFYTGGELKLAEVDGALKVAITNLEEIDQGREPTESPDLNRRRAIQILKRVRENESKK